MDFDTFIQEIEEYLPIDYYDDENNAYKTYLIEALTENWENEKYQFCILAANMLFMSFLYKGFWFLIDKNVPKVERIIRSQESYNKPENMFLLSPIVEDKFVETYTGVFGIHPNAKREYTRLIDVRNECVHASGTVQYGKEDMPSKFQEYHKAIEKIFIKHKPYFRAAFQKVFEHYLNNDLYEKTSYEFFDGFCAKEKVSVKELAEIKGVLDGMSLSKGESDYTVKCLTLLLLKYYISNKTNGLIDYDLDKLKEDIFSLGRENSTDVKIIIDRLEDERTVSSYQVILEEDFQDIINKLSDIKESTRQDFIMQIDIPSVGE